MLPGNTDHASLIGGVLLPRPLSPPPGQHLYAAPWHPAPPPAAFPMASTMLILHTSQGEEVRTYPDTDGSFTFYDVPAGAHQLRPFHPNLLFPEVRLQAAFTQPSRVPGYSQLLLVINIRVGRCAPAQLALPWHPSAVCGGSVQHTAQLLQLTCAL